MDIRGNERTKIYLLLFLGVVIASSSSILIRWSSTHPLVTAFYRMLIASAIMSSLALCKGRPNAYILHKSFSFILLSGIMLGIHFASWMSSLAYTSVSVSVIIVDSSPLLVVLLTHYFLNESIPSRSIMGIIIAFIGGFVIVADNFDSSTSLYGILLAFMGSVALSLYLVTGRKVRKDIDTLTYVTIVYAFATLSLLCMVLASGFDIAAFTGRDMSLYVALALGPTCFGHTIYNHCLEYVKASTVSVSILAEPIGASLLAFFFLDESPTLYVIIGGALVLFGISRVLINEEDIY